MQLKYKLTSVGSKKNGDRIPMIDVRVTNPDTGQAVNYRAMLDSGAFANVFHSEIAEILGIDLTEKLQEISFGGVKETGGISMKGKVCILELMVVDKGKSHKFQTPVIFSNEVSKSGFALLGRRGFFDQFNQVIFNYTESTFSLAVS